MKENAEGLKMKLLLQWSALGSNFLHIIGSENKVVYMKFFLIEAGMFFPLRLQWDVFLFSITWHPLVLMFEILS